MSSPAPGARICVTGGLGFIGTHLCRALVERGYQVACVDRAARASYGRGVPHPFEGAVSVLRADVSATSLATVLEGSSAVIHLAALPGVRADHAPAELWRHNVTAAERVAESLPVGCRMVLASTSSVYGNATRLPTPESAPEAPLNPYALTKLEAELAAMRAAEHGADVVVCRLFTVFGPGQRTDMAFSRWITSILDEQPVPWCAPPRARREFTYVGDAVRGLIAALERGRAGEVYNLAGSGSSPVRSALAEIEGLLGRRARLSKRPAQSEAVATAACGVKSERELGHVPCVSLCEGIERQLEAALSESMARPAAA